MVDDECKTEGNCNTTTPGNIVPNAGVQEETETSEKVIEEPEENQNCEIKILENSDSSIKPFIPSLSFEHIKLITGSWNEFRHKNKRKEIFLKGCKWSPDGTCLLTNSDDATMRLFDLPLELYNCHTLSKAEFPELQPALKTKIGGLVYDYAWYPLMTSTNPATCCFATTSFSAPVQLWDAYSGDLRCSYRGFSLMDELHAALSVAFSPCGGLILCGYKDNIKIFKTDIPGRDCFRISTKELCEQRGIISCFAVNPEMPNIFAAGSYDKTVGMYTTDGHAMCLFKGQGGGLTQLKFSQDGTRLYTGGRKDPEILCWDIRNLGQILYVLKRPHSTNQRIYFDTSADDRYLLSGSSDGDVRVWDLQSGLQTGKVKSEENDVLKPTVQWRAHNDCVNGLSVHRHIPLVATASGQRYIPELVEDEDMEFELERPQDKFEDSVKLWWTGPVQIRYAAANLHTQQISIEFLPKNQKSASLNLTFKRQNIEQYVCFLYINVHN